MGKDWTGGQRGQALQREGGIKRRRPGAPGTEERPGQAGSRPRSAPSWRKELYEGLGQQLLEGVLSHPARASSLVPGLPHNAAGLGAAHPGFCRELALPGAVSLPALGTLPTLRPGRHCQSRRLAMPWLGACAWAATTNGSEQAAKCNHSLAGEEAGPGDLLRAPWCMELPPLPAGNWRGPREPALPLE